MIEQTILNNLMTNEEYARRVLPYLEVDYFDNPAYNTVFNAVKEHINKYNKLPTKETIEVDVSKLKLPHKNEAIKILKDLTEEQADNFDWLIDATEAFCQEQAIQLAVIKSVEIIKDEKQPNGAIPKILEDALAVSFSTDVGHDYLDDAEARWEFYHAAKKRVPFDIDLLNDITDGGVANKTLTVLAGATGFGKTALMCHFAASQLVMGKNVLYITMEMARELVAERIDANLLDVSLKELRKIPKSTFDARLERIRSKTAGKLKIQEYAPGTAGAGNFRHLLHELRIKKNFVPDIIYVDYVNLVASSRVKMSANMGMYLYVKMVAEELRAIGVDYDLPLITATQINRSGFEDSDPGMQHTAESFGLPATADYMWIIIVNDELLAMNQVMLKQAKNRYADPNNPRKFIIGRDLEKMRLFNVSQVEQEDIVENKMDKAEIKSKFSGFK